MKLHPLITRRKIYLTLLLICGAALSLAVVILPLVEESLQPVPKVEQLASRDYRAVNAVSFISQIRTEQRRTTEADKVPDIYTPPDTRVARRQLEQLRAALAYITSVRSDTYASPGQKVKDLATLEDVTLSSDAVRTVLQLSDARWQEVQQGALGVLERIMSSVIRPDSLADIRQRAPSMVSLSFPEDQAALIAELAGAFVASNSQFSPELTEAARQQARAAVEPASRNFIAGQTVVRQGEVLDAEDVEALYALGLVQPGAGWQDLLSAGLMTLLMVFFVSFYLHRKQSLNTGDVRKIAILVLLQATFLGLTRLVIPTYASAAYAFPLAAYALTATALFGMELALVTSVPLSILAGYGLPNSLELTLYFLVCSVFGGLTLGRGRRLLAFLMAGLAISSSGLVVILIQRLPLSANNPSELGGLAAAALVSGLTSTSIAILLHSLLAQLLGQITPMQMVELTRPDHPLLRKLLRDAPGTYQHSLQVANLAEQAAERIGADPLLTRVGALYHDVGKTVNPIYYIENQPPGFANPHDGLSPEESATQIIRHVQDGLTLGRSYRLPQRILDFASEHHGTGLTRYQYNKAIKAVGGDASQVNPENFRYPGPRPRSRETAILMLADGCEARVRAERPATDEQMREVIKAVIADRIANGQLDDTRLTLHDLTQIADSFFITLRGFYHPRLDYSKVDQPARLPAGSGEADPTVPVAHTLATGIDAPTLPRGQRPNPSP